MSEEALWIQARENLGPFGRFVRVENRVDVGFPDVLYTLGGTKGPRTGLIELKHEAAMANPVLLSILTLEQVLWHEAWIKAGGRSYFLCQFGRGYYLFGGWDARRLFERDIPADHAPLISLACDPFRFPTNAIIRELRR